MHSGNSFEVVVRRKVPYLTSFLFYLLMVFVLAFVLLDFFFLPAKNSPDEMKVAYFILIVPEFVKKVLFISGIGFAIILPLYINARIYKRATLTFLPDNIVIQGNKLSVDIPTKTLRRVYCMDSHSITGHSREKLTIYFLQKRNATTRVRLRHYVQSDSFMERLMQYENIDFKMYNFNVSPDLENEG